MPSLSKNQVELLLEPHIAQFVTLMENGSPQISPVWVDTDGENILVNTATGRLKTDNIHRDARVGIAVFDPMNPYSRGVNISCLVSDISELGAIEHINTLAKKYTGDQIYQGHNNHETRLIIVIQPTMITGC